MAPSNVFSYFRPHHRKNNSNPTSPDVNQSSASFFSPNSQHESLRPPSRSNYDSHSPNAQTPVSPLPPILPSIPRVASIYGPPPGLSPVKQESARFDRDNALGIAGLHDKELGHEYQTESANRIPERQASSPPGSWATAATTSPGIQSNHLSPREPPNSRPPLRPTNNTYLHPQANNSTNAMTTRANLSPGPTAAEFSQPLRSPVQDFPQPTKSSRGRLNLLNPMSILMRRRSSQTLESSHQEPSPVTRLDTMPEGYDPSIRGNKVHDFSAPRPPPRSSHSSSNAYDAVDGDRRASNPSPPKRAHTPAFTENFDEDLQPQEVDRAMRAEQLANKGFLKRMSIPSPPPGVTPPAIAEGETQQSKRNSGGKPLPLLPTDENISPSRQGPLSPVLEVDGQATELDDAATIKRATSGARSSRSRAASYSDPNFQPSAIPKHMTSKSSRFSFQMGGGDSAAQEKLLEERHKQKAAAKAADSPQPASSAEEPEDDFDEDAMYEDMMNDDYDDGYGEEIPTAGGELYEDDFGDDGTVPEDDLDAFDFGAMRADINNPTSTVASPNQMQTPVDAQGDKIGYALTEAMNKPQSHTSPLSHEVNESALSAIDGTADLPQPAIEVPAGQDECLKVQEEASLLSQQSVEAARLQSGILVDADDMYFDDGMIDDFDADQGEAFDESVFDDPTHPLYERKPVANIESVADVPEHSMLAPKPSVHHPSLTKNNLGTVPELPSATFTDLHAYHSALANALNRAEADGRFTRHDSLDVNSNMDAQSPIMSPSEVTSSSRPSLVPDDERHSMSTAPFSPTDLSMGDRFPVDDQDYGFDAFDPEMDDEAMVAAANAEALANDYDGTYGRDFGFYANPALQGESVAFQGGYFGTPEQMLGRSISGRNAVREPNLTPITEHSEYSTRNSFIGNQFGFPSSGTTQSPGLVQLARLSPYGFPDDDSDITMERFLKLRRGAFGESNRSSANSSPRLSTSGESGLKNSSFVSSNMNNSSPHSLRDTDRRPSHGAMSRGSFSEDVLHQLEEDSEEDSFDDEEIQAANMVHEEYASDDPFESDDEDEAKYQRDADAASLSSHGSPTITRLDPSYTSTPLSALRIPLSLTDTSIPPPAFSFPAAQPVQPISLIQNNTITQHPPPPTKSQHPISPTSPTAGGIPKRASWQTHSRTSSAADSVTYVRERDEMGEQRWVLERRRTSEMGEVLVGREVVEGGRI